MAENLHLDPNPIGLHVGTGETRRVPPILQFFDYEHLPPHLQEISKPFGDLARQMAFKLPDNAENSTMLRKLLEAKDCAVRALLGK